jgi:ankyrin repeat protein
MVKNKAAVGLSIQDIPEDGEHLRVDRAGRLPLHIAAMYGNVEVVEVRACMMRA